MAGGAFQQGVSHGARWVRATTLRSEWGSGPFKVGFNF
ncbi:hypothetical protein SynA1524_02475 [Synechococcus sp. A15-24]|nr:hypothetical protein SynA1524_02475 [Synechococcus sp. A15-24]